MGHRYERAAQKQGNVKNNVSVNGVHLTNAVPVQAVLISVPFGQVDEIVSAESQSQVWLNAVTFWGSHVCDTELGKMICVHTAKGTEGRQGCLQASNERTRLRP